MLEVSFEMLIARPLHVLGEIADFFEIGRGPGEGDWVTRAASLVESIPPPRISGLSSPERSLLLEACAPGAELLGPA